jgi:hypothetical protein
VLRRSRDGLFDANAGTKDILEHFDSTLKLSWTKDRSSERLR